MGTIDVPPDVYDALNVPEEKREEVFRRELALSLYREETVPIFSSFWHQSDVIGTASCWASLSD